MRALRLTMTRVRRLQGDDRGFTMLETVVGMVIMTIFMGIFTGAVVTMYSSANKAEALSNSTGQLNLAFDRLDKEIRYASYVGSNAGVRRQLVRCLSDDQHGHTGRASFG